MHRHCLHQAWLGWLPGARALRWQSTQRRSRTATRSASSASSAPCRLIFGRASMARATRAWTSCVLPTYSRRAPQCVDHAGEDCTACGFAGAALAIYWPRATTGTKWLLVLECIASAASVWSLVFWITLERRQRGSRFAEPAACAGGRRRQVPLLPAICAGLRHTGRVRHPGC